MLRDEEKKEEQPSARQPRSEFQQLCADFGTWKEGAQIVNIMPGISLPKWLASANQELLQFMVKWCFKDDDSRLGRLQLIQNSRDLERLSELADNPVVHAEFAAAK